METDALAETRDWIRENPLTLLVFTTPDCGVCNALRPAVEQVAARHSLLQVRYVDLDQSPGIAGQFGVFVVPVYVLSVLGKETVRFARHFGIRELEEAVERYSSVLEDR